MRQFEVMALSVGGRGNRIHNSGAIVREDEFVPNSVGTLLLTKAIREVKGVNESSFDAPERFKVAIITAMWKRERVFKVFAELTNAMIEGLPDHDFKVFCVGSEGNASRELAESFGFTYIEHTNDKLGQKWNAVTRAARSFNPDYCLMMGSDDVMTPDLFNRYLPYMRNGIDYIGTLDWYFYDTVTRKSLYWKGYRKAFNRGVTCGAGRMLSGRLMNALDWEPWENDRNHNLLDTAMENRLKGINHSRASFIIGDLGGMGLDIKSSTNMTPFAEWDNAETIPNDEVFKHFNKKQKALICAA
jgi:hypothetical protein